MQHRAARAAKFMHQRSCSSLAASVKSLLARTTGHGSPAEEVLVRGWVRTVRAQKGASFMQVSDGSCQGTIQVVAPSGSLQGVTVGSSVSVKGHLVPSPAKGQTWEVAVPEGGRVDLVGPAEGAEYPLQKKGHSVEFLRSIPHLRARSNLGGAAFRIRNALSAALHAHLQSLDFLHMHTPLITSSDCEGAGEVFAVAPWGAPDGSEFFGKPAFLTVSGQLHAEAFACGLGKVYTFGPTFRAEDSNTSRHLAEFWMLEPEVAWASLPDVMDLAETCIKAAVHGARERVADDLAFCAARVDQTLPQRLGGILKEGGDVAPGTFARMTYTEAVEVLQSSGQSWDKPVAWGDALGTEHEKWLAEEHVRGPVFVTDYPAAVKPVYMLANDEGEREAGAPGPTVACVDLLVPKLAELVGGSAREHRHAHLEAAMSRGGLLESGELQWYLDLRKFGSVPHAGWGLGFERLVQLVSGVENIRDVIPFPRAPGLCPM